MRETSLGKSSPAFGLIEVDAMRGNAVELFPTAQCSDRVAYQPFHDDALVDSRIRTKPLCIKEFQRHHQNNSGGRG